MKNVPDNQCVSGSVVSNLPWLALTGSGHVGCMLVVWGSVFDIPPQCSPARVLVVCLFGRPERLKLKVGRGMCVALLTACTSPLCTHTTHKSYTCANAPPPHPHTERQRERAIEAHLHRKALESVEKHLEEELLCEIVLELLLVLLVGGTHQWV